MLRADFDDLPEPDAISSSVAEEARSQAESFFKRSPTERSQETFSADESVFASEDVRQRLFTLFHGKCAYCESPLTVPDIQVDQFRPPSGALDLKGGISPSHYSWLAYTWENLLPSCGDCRSFKGARFPVRARRAAKGTTGAALLKERALLLDPRHDHPEQHLVYAEDGSVASTTPEGQTTIEVLGFNRSQLISARTSAHGQVRHEWELLVKRLDDPAAVPESSEVEALFSTALPYAGLRRQFVNGWLQSRRLEIDKALSGSPAGISSVDEVAAEVLVVSSDKRKAVKSQFEARVKAQDSYSLDSDATTGDYFGRTRRIERIVIKNFKVIRSLDLELQRIASETAEAPWLMLLGENGCGKSSVLQAVGLALMGEKARSRLGLDASTFVTNGARRGSVEVHLTGSAMPITVEFSRDSQSFRGEGDTKVLLLGYGATRLLPRGKLRAPPVSGAVRVENLFNPFSPIGSATEWLLSFPTRRKFDVVATGLKSLLDLKPDDRLIQNKRKGRIEVEAYGRRVPLELQSDGPQSVIALATDVMSVLLQRWPSIQAAEGTVLVDELGAHLHPRWRMRIVSSLRRVFPRVQFISSTHDPLCLRGVGDGEVVLLRRNADDDVSAITDLPSPAGLRVDQLLGSELFGLGSTVDPELDWLFAEYYELKAKHSLSAREQRRYEDLRVELDGKKVLGTTRRDRLVLEAADEFLAHELEHPSQDERTTLREATKKKIAEIWAGAGPP